MLCFLSLSYCTLDIVFNNFERISNCTQDQLNCACKNIKTDFYYFHMKNLTIGEKSVLRAPVHKNLCENNKKKTIKFHAKVHSDGPAYSFTAVYINILYTNM